MRWRARVLVGAACVGTGLGLAASLPPWGWWPLAFVAVAAWDRLLADRPWASRLLRSWLVGIAWLLPALLWMWDLTAPGYVVAVVVFGGYFGVAGALVPPAAPYRWVGLPAAVLLAEVARAHFPFEGIPLATLAMGQAGAPLGGAARVGTAFLVSGLVAVGGVALSAGLARRWRAAAVALAVLVVAAGAGAVAPRGHVVGETTYAIVQGGGPQRTRAAGSDPREVLQRHLEASDEVTGPVDLVVWPENVVDVDGPLAGSPQAATLSALARRLDTTLVVGVTEDVGVDRFHNASVVFLPDGSQGDQYVKVRRVPFGEYVPLRGLVEALAGRGSGLPRRDAVSGTGPAVVRTPAGTLAVAISWEVFFVDRVRDGVSHGGEILINPTNGSSYWLTQVQSQQVASSQLRAIESGRWVLQAAPTGFSAVVDPSGQVLARSAISEPWVHQGTVERRQGDTIATTWGPGPVVVAAVGALAAAWAWAWAWSWSTRRGPGREQAGAPPSAGLSPTAPGRDGRP